MATYLQAYLETGYFMGTVLVACAGEVLLSQGYGMANLEHSVPNIPQTKFRLGSITKQFTATAILQLQEQGLLNVHDSISTYLPDYPNGNKITIHHLLNHTGGIPSYTSFPDFIENKRIKKSLDELIAWFSHRPLEFTPGDRFEYSNSGYVVLTKIIETTSGKSYADYLQHHLFEPVGMTDSGYDLHEQVLSDRASGYIYSGEEYQNAEFIDMSLPSGAGALYSTVEDLYKWDSALYTNAVLSESSKKLMFAPTVLVDPPTDTADPPTQTTHYGYGWLLDTHYERDRLFHGGGIDGFTTSISRYLDEQITIIVLSNILPAPSDHIASDLAAILFGKPYEMPKKRQAIELDPAVYEAYVGKYQLSPEVMMTVTTENQRIFTQITGQEPVEIFPESSTEFFLKVVDAQIKFVVNETGRVSHLILYQNGREILATRVG